MPTSTPRISTSKKRAFLTALVDVGGNVTAAAHQVGMDRGVHYDWLRDDPAYKAEYENEVEPKAAERLEDEARRRGMLGVEEPVFYEGRRVDVIRKYSDTLLIFLLKGAKPEKYRDNIAFKGTVDIANGGNELDAELRGFFAGMAAAREADVPVDG